ncbi:hypothetical protein HMPREF1982_03520 [Clostridiales bacterium oral taxon 876 str. F0540]|nr:hypothetical protein HMPREF1982_03520 [Clostridiales bacterium oral taxon 876 str. F0540]
MIGGLDLIIIDACKTFIFPIITNPARLFMFIAPVGLVLSKSLDKAIKERGKR